MTAAWRTKQARAERHRQYGCRQSRPHRSATLGRATVFVRPALAMALIEEAALVGGLVIQEQAAPSCAFLIAPPNP